MNDETVSLAYLPKDELIVLPISRRCKEKAKEQYHQYYYARFEG